MDGTPCPITANEVRQLLASGNIEGTPTAPRLGTTPPARGTGPRRRRQGRPGRRRRLRAAEPELACSVGHGCPTCTDPEPQHGLRARRARRRDRAAAGHLPLPLSQGLGRVLRLRAPGRVQVGGRRRRRLDPARGRTSPRRNGSSSSTRPRRRSPSTDTSSARTAYTCRVEVAPGAQPNNGSPPPPAGDFANVSSDILRRHHGPHHPSQRPARRRSTPTRSRRCSRPTSRASRATRTAGSRRAPTGAPTRCPYAFTVRVVARARPRSAGPGDDRRGPPPAVPAPRRGNAQGLPVEMHGDGDASPLLVDLAGNDTNQLVVANSDGWIHAYPRAERPQRASRAGRSTPTRCRCTRASAYAYRRRVGRPTTRRARGAGRRRPDRRRGNGHRRRRP